MKVDFLTASLVQTDGNKKGGLANAGTLYGSGVSV